MYLRGKHTSLKGRVCTDENIKVSHEIFHSIQLLSFALLENRREDAKMGAPFPGFTESGHSTLA